MNHYHIESENPEHHWNLLKVDNEIVLDLGCGFHLLEDGWKTTPEYFLDKGAKKIIGVDMNFEDIFKLRKMFPAHSFFCDSIDSIEKINSYINDTGTTSLKMDIEGYEELFILSTNNFDNLKYVAIETHSKTLLARTITKLQDLNFKIDTLCTFYPEVYDVCNLVYAHR
jgi:hypothetical protein